MVSRISEKSISLVIVWFLKEKQSGRRSPELSSARMRIPGGEIAIAYGAMRGKSMNELTREWRGKYVCKIRGNRAEV
jgi:hypothetical protein